jgi:uncharacterized membrane protein YfcA
VGTDLLQASITKSVGSLVAARVPDRLLRPMLATTLVLVGARLVR